MDRDKVRDLALQAGIHQVYGNTDPFWIRWRYVGEKQGWLE